MRTRAFTLLELVIGLAIFVLAFFPIAQLMTNSRRVTAASLRFLEASTHAQTLLEAILPLDLDDLPPGTGEWTLLSTMGPNPPGGGPRWNEIRRYFEAPTAFPMTARVVAARRIPDPADPTRPDRVVIRVKVEFLRLVTVEDSVEEVVMEGLLDPRL